ncbi:hypothetical protein AMATHDRAFT_51697 [Amanita thiersii Skay4041]|uniref:Uncharacterized protein n=1 Tax=Amanita thiersii Skay4041 TaxID=703135 RepID=A0A2A9N7E7_9AGAR|nr:hypothetical protein AMATHDRAFT_51697 [Amanita thiersii Skay4041]
MPSFDAATPQLHQDVMTGPLQLPNDQWDTLTSFLKHPLCSFSNTIDPSLKNPPSFLRGLRIDQVTCIDDISLTDNVGSHHQDNDVSSAAKIAAVSVTQATDDTKDQDPISRVAHSLFVRSESASVTQGAAPQEETSSHWLRTHTTAMDEQGMSPSRQSRTASDLEARGVVLSPSKGSEESASCAQCHNFKRSLHHPRRTWVTRKWPVFKPIEKRKGNQDGAGPDEPDVNGAHGNDNDNAQQIPSSGDKPVDHVVTVQGGTETNAEHSSAKTEPANPNNQATQKIVRTSPGNSQPTPTNQGNQPTSSVNSNTNQPMPQTGGQNSGATNGNKQTDRGDSGQNSNNNGQGSNNDLSGPLLGNDGGSDKHTDSGGSGRSDSKSENSGKKIDAAEPTKTTGGGKKDNDQNEATAASGPPQPTGNTKDGGPSNGTSSDKGVKIVDNGNKSSDDQPGKSDQDGNSSTKPGKDDGSDSPGKPNGDLPDTTTVSPPKANGSKDNPPGTSGKVTQNGDNAGNKGDKDHNGANGEDKDKDNNGANGKDKDKDKDEASGNGNGNSNGNSGNGSGTNSGGNNNGNAGGNGNGNGSEGGSNGSEDGNDNGNGSGNGTGNGGGDNNGNGDGDSSGNGSGDNNGNGSNGGNGDGGNEGNNGNNGGSSNHGTEGTIDIPSCRVANNNAIVHTQPGKTTHSGKTPWQETSTSVSTSSMSGADNRYLTSITPEAQSVSGSLSTFTTLQTMVTTIVSGGVTSVATTVQTITGTTIEPSSTHIVQNNNTGAIAGATVGAVLFALATIFTIFFCLRRKRRERRLVGRNYGATATPTPWHEESATREIDTSPHIAITMTRTTETCAASTTPDIQTLTSSISSLYLDENGPRLLSSNHFRMSTATTSTRSSDDPYRLSYIPDIVVSTPPSSTGESATLIGRDARDARDPFADPEPATLPNPFADPTPDNSTSIEYRNSKTSSFRSIQYGVAV